VCSFRIEVFIRDEEEVYQQGTSRLTAMSGSKTILQTVGDYVERKARDYVKKENLQISDPSKNSPLGELARETVQTLHHFKPDFDDVCCKIFGCKLELTCLTMESSQPPFTIISASMWHQLKLFVIAIFSVNFSSFPDDCLYIQSSAVSKLLYKVDRSNTNSQNSDFVRRAVDMENHMMESQYVHTKPILYLLQVFMPRLSTFFSGTSYSSISWFLFLLNTQTFKLLQ